jgi:hypothetical protein
LVVLARLKKRKKKRKKKEKKKKQRKNVRCFKILPRMVLGATYSTYSVWIAFTVIFE